jgi:hypothetical protein
MVADTRTRFAPVNRFPMPDVSIVICTHNPGRPSLARCLGAVHELQGATPFATEVILVDNNSTPAIQEFEDVGRFLASGPSRCILRENTLGLTFARLAGFRASRGETIVFVDDDAVLRVDYLTSVTGLVGKYPAVGVWGPGIVDVEWEEGTPQWLRAYASVFQAKQRTRCEFGAVVGWPDYYPAGTGMVVRRSVLETYQKQVERRQLTAVDRCGTRLTSGGDGQIVWTAVSMGLCAGTSPALRLTHIVARKKAHPVYICRMIFSVMASGHVAMAECFPEMRDNLRAALPSAIQSHAMVLAAALKALLLLRIRSGLVAIVSLAGELHGRFLAAGERSPMLTRLIAQLLRFE